MCTYGYGKFYSSKVSKIYPGGPHGTTSSAGATCSEREKAISRCTDEMRVWTCNSSENPFSKIQKITLRSTKSYADLRDKRGLSIKQFWLETTKITLFLRSKHSNSCCIIESNMTWLTRFWIHLSVLRTGK